MASTWPELHSGTNFNYVWEVIGLEWVKETQATGGGGGGGGACTIADGADVAEGATTDAESASGNGSVIALLKRLRTLFGASSATGTLNALNATVSIAVVGGQTVGFRFEETAFNGTIAAEISTDGGTHWSETDFYNPLSAATYNRSSRLTGGFSSDFAIATAAGVTNVRLKVITYVSGSAAITLSATQVPFIPPSSVAAADSYTQGIVQVGGRYASATGTMKALWLTDSAPATNALGLAVREVQATAAPGGAVPAEVRVFGAKDLTDNTVRTIEATTTAPAGTERGLVTRNLPSGTQNIGSKANTTSTGTITALNGTVTLATAGLAGVGVQITGVWVATLKLQGTIDGSNWENIIPYLPATRAYGSTTAFIVANGIYVANVAPFASVRLLASAYTSGTATVSFAGSVISVTPSSPSAQNVTVTNGTGSGAANVTIDSIALGSAVGIDQSTPGTTNKVSIGTDGVVSSKIDLTPSAPTVATVGVASGQAVAAAATRKGLILRNLSTTGQRISLGFGSVAVLDSGVTLYPQDAFNMGEFDFDLGAVNAISSAASGSLSVQEYLT